MTDIWQFDGHNHYINRPLLPFIISRPGLPHAVVANERVVLETESLDEAKLACISEANRSLDALLKACRDEHERLDKEVSEADLRRALSDPKTEWRFAEGSSPWRRVIVGNNVMILANKLNPEGFSLLAGRRNEQGHYKLYFLNQDRLPLVLSIIAVLDQEKRNNPT